MRRPNIKKLAAVAVATTINAGLLLGAGPVSKFLRLPNRVLPFYLLGMIFTWYIVFTALLFLASSLNATGRKRVVRVLGESTIAIVIFGAVLLYAFAHLQ